MSDPRFTQEESRELMRLARVLDLATMERSFAYGTSSYDEARAAHDQAWAAFVDYVHGREEQKGETDG